MTRLTPDMLKGYCVNGCTLMMLQGDSLVCPVCGTKADLRPEAVQVFDCPKCCGAQVVCCVCGGALSASSGDAWECNDCSQWQAAPVHCPVCG